MPFLYNFCSTLVHIHAGTPLPTQLPDDALDYTQQHLLSPTAEAAAPNYFSLEEQDQDMNPSTSDASVRPPYRLYCCLLRLQQLEVEVHVRLYLEYPVRPPLLLVQSVRELPKDGKKGRPRLLDAHNEKLVMEQEVRGSMGLSAVLVGVAMLSVEKFSGCCCCQAAGAFNQLRWAALLQCTLALQYGHGLYWEEA